MAMTCRARCGFTACPWGWRPDGVDADVRTHRRSRDRSAFGSLGRVGDPHVGRHHPMSDSAEDPQAEPHPEPHPVTYRVPDRDQRYCARCDAPCSTAEPLACVDSASGPSRALYACATCATSYPLAGRLTAAASTNAREE